MKTGDMRNILAFLSANPFLTLNETNISLPERIIILDSFADGGWNDCKGGILKYIYEHSILTFVSSPPVALPSWFETVIRQFLFLSILFSLRWKPNRLIRQIHTFTHCKIPNSPPHMHTPNSKTIMQNVHQNCSII